MKVAQLKFHYVHLLWRLVNVTPLNFHLRSYYHCLVVDVHLDDNKTQGKEGIAMTTISNQTWDGNVHPLVLKDK